MTNRIIRCQYLLPLIFQSSTYQECIKVDDATEDENIVSFHVIKLLTTTQQNLQPVIVF